MTMNVKNGDKMYHIELNNRLEAYKRNGVLEGLLVYERDTPSMILNVTAGQCYVDNELYYEIGLNTVTIPAAHATLPRLDIVCYDTSGNNPADINGTASATPIPPDIPAGDILLALVEVPPACTTIENCHIKDERIIIKPIGLKYDASDDLLTSDDTESTYDNTTYVIEKELGPVPDDVFEDESEFRIKFDIKSENGATTVYGRIYRNGVAVGTEQSTTSTTYVTKSEDISGWSAGDLIQLYTKTGTSGVIVYVENYRVYGGIEYTSVYDW